MSPQHPAEKAQRVYKDFVDENNQHVRVVANDPYVCTSTPEVTPQHRAQNPCKHFLQGHCNRGTACRFYHPDEPLTVTLRMGTPRRSPQLGPKISSPGGVTDDGPEPPAMVLPPSATAVSAATSLTPRTNDPYKLSPKQKFSSSEDSRPLSQVAAEFALPVALNIPVSESAAPQLVPSFPTIRLPLAPPPSLPPAVAAARDSTPVYTDDMPPRSDVHAAQHDADDDDDA